MGLKRLFGSSVPGSEAERVWSRAWRDFERISRSWLARVLLVVLDAALAVVVAELLVSANKASVSVGLLTLVSIVGGPVAAGLIVYLAQAVLAVVRQRDEARGLLPAERDRFQEAQVSYRESFDQKFRENEDLRGQLGVALARVAELEDFHPTAVHAAGRLKTELTDAHRKATAYVSALEVIPPERGLHYEAGFRFRAAVWEEYGILLAGHGTLYATVEEAYQELGRVNDLLGGKPARRVSSASIAKKTTSQRFLDLPAWRSRP